MILQSQVLEWISPYFFNLIFRYRLNGVVKLTACLRLKRISVKPIIRLLILIDNLIKKTLTRNNLNRSLCLAFSTSGNDSKSTCRIDSNRTTLCRPHFATIVDLSCMGCSDRDLNVKVSTLASRYTALNRIIRISLFFEVHTNMHM